VRGHKAPQVQSGFLANRPLPADHVRCYVQDLAGGVPVSTTPEGTYSCLISPDAKLIVAERPRGKISLYQVADGNPVPVSGLEPKDQLIRFEKDGGHHLYVYQYEEGDAEAKIFRLETATGR